MGEQHRSDEARDDEFRSSAARRSSGSPPSPAASQFDRPDSDPQLAERTSPSDAGSTGTNFSGANPSDFDPSDASVSNCAASPSAPLRAGGADHDHASVERPSQLENGAELGRPDENLVSRDGLQREDSEREGRRREDSEREGLQRVLTSEPSWDRFDQQVRAALEQVDVPVGLAAMIQLRLSAAERETWEEVPALVRSASPVPSAEQTLSAPPNPSAEQARSGPPVPGGLFPPSAPPIPSAEQTRSTPPIPSAEQARSARPVPGGVLSPSGPPVPGGVLPSSARPVPGGSLPPSTPSLPRAGNRRWWWLAAAAVVLAVIAPRLWLTQPLQLDALAVVDESLTWVGKVSRLQTWQSYEGEPSSPYPATRLVAGVVQRFSSWPTKWDPDARVYEYRSQAAQPSYCFVVHFDRKLEGPGYLPPRTPLRAGSGWTGACWQEGAYLYIVVVPGGERDYLQAVEAGRQLAVNSPSPASFAKL